MIAFIVCCSLMAILVENQNPYLMLLTSPIALGVNGVLLVASLVLGYFKKLPTIIWHDAFLTTGLLVWFGYWKPLFSEDSPMFLFFPIYFALITAFVTLTLILRCTDFDRQSIDHLRYFDKLTRLDTNVSIVFVIISIFVPEHYALYSMAITFFVVRHTITVCLENWHRLE